MLARLALLLIALPAVALAQNASAPPATATASPPAATAPVSQTPTPLTAQPQLASAPPTDPAQCRLACDQTNYFCRSGDQPDDCGGAWSQCVSTCDLPDLNPGVSTAP
jgi:hypothetical protein